MTKKFFFTLILLFSLSCKTNFYEHYQVSDLWRLPLLEPYELLNIAGATEYQANNDNWHITFKHPDQVKGEKALNVTMINIENGIIYGYGTVVPCDYFIIIPGEDKEFIFKNIEDWEVELGKMKIDPVNIFNVFDLFYEFKEKGILKWRSQIKK